jgi:DNA-binding NarL/FixJ family response regulator
VASRPRLLIVDDHKVVAEGLVRLLGDRFEILETITDGSLVLDAVSRLHPDVILLDLSMPNVGGLEAMRQLTEHGVESRTIILTMHADANLAVESLKAGAAGFALKESSSEELLAALDVVLGGGTYLTSGLTKDVVTLMVGATDPNRVALTSLQREVLRLIVRGQRAKEIAGSLDIPTRSVEAIKYRIMRLLNVHSTAELVGYAIEHHLVAF